MKNLKATVSSVLLMASAIVAHATANSVVLTQNSDSFNVGGEFNANTTQSFIHNYSPSAVVGTGFETFCIETMVDFNPGQTYTYNLSSVDSRGVNLSRGAAYLYSQFAKGILANYDYTDPTIRNLDAGALQSAIWWFQGNQTYSGYPSPTDNVYYEEALNALGGLGGAEIANGGYYGVDVLQMWGDGHIAAQNQLVLVPDRTTTIGLFVMALGALALVRPPVLARVQFKAA
jgi:hypothetical protein